VSSHEHGGAAVEIVVVAPILVVMLLFVVGLGRLGTAREAVDGAARDGAREASIARRTIDATSAASDTVNATLAEKQVSCPNPAVHVDYAPTPGRLTAGGTVTVRVACTVQNGDVVLSGLPGTSTLHADATAVVDTYRGTHDRP
jgi:Flp pilus assembly protein TadG